VSMDASHFLVRRIEVDGGSLQPQFEPGSTAFTVELKDREYDDVETLRIQVTLLANPGRALLANPYPNPHAKPYPNPWLALVRTLRRPDKRCSVSCGAVADVLRDCVWDRPQVWDARTVVYVHGRVHGPCRLVDEAFYVNASIIGDQRPGGDGGERWEAAHCSLTLVRRDVAAEVREVSAGGVALSVPLQLNVTQAVDGTSNTAVVRLTPLDFGATALTIVAVLPGRGAFEPELRLAYTLKVTRFATEKHSKLAGATMQNCES
jgi:hypothetical protein